MKYELYEAVDTRDNRPMLWLHDRVHHRVATFCPKWAPSRIKHKTAAAPSTIVWEPELVMLEHAALANAKQIDSWSFDS